MVGLQVTERLLPIKLPDDYQINGLISALINKILNTGKEPLRSNQSTVCWTLSKFASFIAC